MTDKHPFHFTNPDINNDVDTAAGNLVSLTNSFWKIIFFGLYLSVQHIISGYLGDTRFIRLQQWIVRDYVVLG